MTQITGSFTYAKSEEAQEFTLPVGAYFQGRKESRAQCSMFRVHVPFRGRKLTCATKCQVLCRDEAAYVPSGRIQAIVNDVGVQFNLPGYPYIECRAGSPANTSTAEAIKNAILSGTANGCSPEGFSVFVGLNEDPKQKQCAVIRLTNSPMRVAFVKINEAYYPFQQQGC